MQTFHVETYGISPGTRTAEKLSQLLHKISGIQEEKTLVFQPGDYLIDSAGCDTEMLFITNTVGDGEFSDGETPHKNEVALNLKNICNLKIEGNGARFVINGKVTNIAVQHCENIEIDGIELTTVNPDLHELEVLKATPFFADFRLDRESRYEFDGKKLFLTGDGYRHDTARDALTAHWIGKIKRGTPNTVQRVSHPLNGALRIREIAPSVFRVYNLLSFRFHKGERFYLFDVRRQYAGIFVNDSKNVAFRNVTQRFNYSLAFVAQDTENITIDSVEFAPDPRSGRLLASLADFIQICMCKGDVEIKNSRFEGAGDDCLNVHGIHFKIMKIDGDKLIVRFMHAQSHGFNPIHAGDMIGFIDPASLLETGRAAVLESALLNEQEIALTLDSAKAAKIGDVIEDITMCPNVRFADNTVNRIITRGLLLTTRGKVVIENNRFLSNSMSGIVLSDDAKSWYESGMCCDVTIRSNIFSYCGEYGILIKPENSVHQGAVHSNIRIHGNTFEKCERAGIRIKSTKDVEIRDNRFGSCKKVLLEQNTEQIQKDF